jgi:addiction module HigA family antidote
MTIKTSFEPVHIGSFIKDMVITETITTLEAAKHLDVPCPALAKLLDEKTCLSPDMALRIEKVFGVKMDTLLKMQVRYDAWQMRRRAHEISLKPYEGG